MKNKLNIAAITDAFILLPKIITSHFLILPILIKTRWYRVPSSWIKKKLIKVIVFVIISLTDWRGCHFRSYNSHHDRYNHTVTCPSYPCRPSTQLSISPPCLSISSHVIQKLNSKNTTAVWWELLKFPASALFITDYFVHLATHYPFNG